MKTSHGLIPTRLLDVLSNDSDELKAKIFTLKVLGTFVGHKPPLL